MSEPFTPDELVLLAEACGYEVASSRSATAVTGANQAGKVWIRCTGGIAPWHPPTNAAQRDEVVEAMRQRPHERILRYMVGNHHATTLPYRAVFMQPGYEDRAEDDEIWAATPGDAVCRAALQALEKSNGEY